jgi:hypothetical protein
MTKRKKNFVTYEVFIKNKNSLRPQHLAFNAFCTKLLWFACPSAVAAMFASSIYHGGDIVFVWELLAIPPLFRLHEFWAGPDSDECYKVKGFRGFYWHLYSRMVPHRSILSHSITLGTPLRFLIGYWPLVLGFVILWNWQLFSQESFQFNNIVVPMFAIQFLGFWYSACVMSDIAHLSLDKLNPIQWLTGGK